MQIVYGLGVSGKRLGQKTKREKLVKFIKIFQLYEVFMLNSCLQNFPNIPNIYITHKENQQILVWMVKNIFVIKKY